MAINIVDIGKALQKYGWTVGENPYFGRVGGHAPGSYHYSGNAIDVTRQGPDMSAAYAGGPEKSWRDLTGELKYRAKRAQEAGLFTQVLGPGDAGHDTHVHLALDPALKGNANVTPELLQWVATGRTKTKDNQLTDVMPGAVPQQQTTSAESAANSLLEQLFNLNQKQKEVSLKDQLLGNAMAQAIQKRLQPQSASLLNTVNPYEEALLDPSKVLS
jgi:hypothetical protein